MGCGGLFGPQHPGCRGFAVDTSQTPFIRGGWSAFVLRGLPLVPFAHGQGHSPLPTVLAFLDVQSVGLFTEA